MFRTPLEPRGWCASDRAQLMVLSILSLFVEIMLIRHLSSEVRIFSYFKNLTLIGAFLGLGYGAYELWKVIVWINRRAERESR